MSRVVPMILIERAMRRLAVTANAHAYGNGGRLGVGRAAGGDLSRSREPSGTTWKRCDTLCELQQQRRADSGRLGSPGPYLDGHRVRLVMLATGLAIPLHGLAMPHKRGSSYAGAGLLDPHKGARDVPARGLLDPHKRGTSHPRGVAFFGGLRRPRPSGEILQHIAAACVPSSSGGEMLFEQGCFRAFPCLTRADGAVRLGFDARPRFAFSRRRPYKPLACIRVKRKVGDEGMGVVGIRGRGDGFVGLLCPDAARRPKDAGGR